MQERLGCPSRTARCCPLATEEVDESGEVLLLPLLSEPSEDPVALLSSVACELAPLRIVLLCVFLYLFFLFFYFSFDTCIVCNDYVRQKNTFGHWTTLH